MQLTYEPDVKARGTLALVGKGITFDTGGISIKPGAKMEDMKFDMSGGAAVLGAFRALRELRDLLEGEFDLKLPQLSMGMSHDFEVAVEEGSTMVRVGTAIFGPRG